VRLPQARHAGPVDHKVEVHVPRGWFQGWLGIDPFETLTPADWLLVPQQQLLEVTAGRVYHDGFGDLTEIRARLAYYPQDVWFYLLACQWGGSHSRRRSSVAPARSATTSDRGCWRRRWCAI
jgi:Domain of unknown function (DUF4037)